MNSSKLKKKIFLDLAVLLLYFFTALCTATPINRDVKM